MSSNHTKGSRCSIDKETLPSLLGTGWFTALSGLYCCRVFIVSLRCLVCTAVVCLLYHCAVCFVLLLIPLVADSYYLIGSI